MQRNMLWYLCPKIDAMDRWVAQCDIIKQHSHLFTGKRVLCLAEGNGLLPLRRIEGYLPPHDVLLTCTNDRKLRETAAGHDMLASVSDEPGITWYGHSKGIIHPPENEAVQKWVSACYETTLTKIHQVDAGMQSGAVLIGPFRRLIPFWQYKGSISTWHFSGTFFWFDNAKLFVRDWQNIENHRYGMESWPSMVAKAEESHCLVGDNCGDLYSLNYWKTGMDQELQCWRDAV